MKKNSFIDGAIIATTCIVICKILGLIYVIPFYKIIGTQGGALYSYAYSIYSMFLNLSTVGIPTAVSKIISEYDALGYHHLKEKSFEVASKMLNCAGIISFIIMFSFSDIIAKSIIGGIDGGNSVSDVSTAIKIVSTALLIVPRLSILKGYFQGNKYIEKASFANVLEQFARVIVIVFGSYVIAKIFGLPVKYAVYVAIFGATIGAFSAYIYLKKKFSCCFTENLSEKNIQEEEKNVSKKSLLRKIIFYAIPFVIISLLQSAYNAVDTFTILRTLTSLGYTTVEAETVIGVMTTWGSKLNMIVVSMSLGLSASLIPNIVSSFAKKDYKDINEKITLSIKMLMFITIPMTLGISFLSEPIWHVFYGLDTFSSRIFSIRILQVISYGLITTLINSSQAMNQTKTTISALLLSFLIKLGLNVPMMYLFSYLGIPAYYAPTITDIVSHLTVFFVLLIVLKRKFSFKYKGIVSYFLKTSFSVGTMILALTILKQYYYNVTSTFASIVTIAIFTVIGALIYFLLSHLFDLLSEIFGKNYIHKILKKVKFIKK